MEEFDYIVVGAGSAGCVVAARLSESGAHRVALLEAGGEDSSFWIHTPLGYGKLHDDPKLNWLYESEPEPELENVKVFQPRGMVLGGTGSINGNVYLRGQPADFNHWEQLGNVGWSYEDVLPYFKKAEDNVRGADRYHGAGGPLRVSDPPRHELCDAFIRAGLEAGYSANEDFNGARYDGFGYNQLTTRRGRRWSTAAGYLRPARGRANLKVILNALATRIVFGNGEARGVEFRQDNVVRTIMASREVILCGGAFNSPQLLQISGVGPANLLREQGVEVVADLPGVGENLQDHFGPSMTYRCTRPITVNDMVNNPIRRLAMGLNYILFHRGLMATNGSFVGACIRTDANDPESEVKLKLGLFAREATGRSGGVVGLMGLHPFPSFSILMSRQHPDSRGTVRIRSKDSATAPEIRFNFFVSNNDRQICVAAVRLSRRIMGMPALAPYVAEEIHPGLKCSSDDELTQFCRQRGRSTYHAVGTCKMGIDDKAVVDPKLRVRGLRRLRVIDASVMPRIVAANPNAAIIMIAEKGAAIVLEDGLASA